MYGVVGGGEVKPRRCQIEAVNAAISSLLEGSPDVVEMVTGSGKSRAQALLIRELKRRQWLSDADRTIVVTSRTDLVDDLLFTFWRLLDPDAQSIPLADRDNRTAAARRACERSAVVGRYDGHRKRIAAVTVTTYPSLAKCLAQVGDVRLLLADEAHRSRAKQAGVHVRSVKHRIGWTATPYPGELGSRLPGWAKIAYSYGAAQAIENGVIVPHEPRYLMEGCGIDPDEDALAGAMLLLHGVEGPGMVTAPDLATAQDMARRLTESGIVSVAAVRRSKVYPDGLTRRELQRLYAQVRAGDVRALVTVDLLAEGFDLPALRWLALCAKPRGRIHLVQVVGRVVRTCPPDRWGEKTRAIVLDPCGVLRRYRLEHPAALGEDGKRPKKARPQTAAERTAEVVQLPYVELVAPLLVWSESLREAARVWAREQDGKRVRVAVRDLPATEAEMGALRRMEGLVRWVAVEEQREMIRAVMAGKDVPAGVVDDLRAVLGFVARRRDHLKKMGVGVLRVQGWFKPLVQVPQKKLCGGIDSGGAGA